MGKKDGMGGLGRLMEGRQDGEMLRCILVLGYLRA